MTKTVLPKTLRLKIIEFYQEGMSSLDIYDLVFEWEYRFNS